MKDHETIDESIEAFEADDVSDKRGTTGSVELTKETETTFCWYGLRPDYKSDEMIWRRSCWNRATKQMALALLEDERFIASGMMKDELKLVKETKTFEKVDTPNVTGEPEKTRK